MLIQFDLCYKNYFPDSLLKQSNQENFDKKTLLFRRAMLTHS